MPESYASKVVHIGGNSYQVPSATEEGLMYDVDTEVGWCACMSGRTGAFCKHQALLYSHFGCGEFPNAPPIDSKDRYLLGLLALGDKCPNFEFFIGLKETVTEELRLAVDSKVQRLKYLEQGGELDSNLNSQLSNAILQHAPTENEINFETNHNDQEQITNDEGSVQDEIDGKAPVLSDELNRIHKLIEKSETPKIYLTHLTRLAERLKQVKNPSQAVSMIIQLSRAAHSYKKKGGRIRVNDTSRRKKESPEAAKEWQQAVPVKQLQEGLRREDPIIYH